MCDIGVWNPGRVQVRPPSVPDEPENTPESEPDESNDFGPAVWRVPTRTILGKSALVLLFAIFAITTPAPERWVGVFIAAALAVYTLRDLTARERLSADAEGVVVARGYFGRRRLSWPEIESVRLDERTRFGAEVRILELDADAEIFLLSRHDLGADPRDVRRHLNALAGRPTEEKPEDDWDETWADENPDEDDEQL